MTRPLTNSSQIVDELSALNTKIDLVGAGVERIYNTLPNRPIQITPEQEAMFRNMGLPVPQPVTPPNPVEVKLDKLIKWNMQVLIAFAVVIILLLMSAVASFDGCSNKSDKDQSNRIRPIPAPIPTPVDVIQLDKTEYAIYKNAIDGIDSGWDMEDKKDHLNLMLGTIAVKKKLLMPTLMNV